MIIIAVSVIAGGVGYFLAKTKPASQSQQTAISQSPAPSPTQPAISRTKETELRKYYKTNSGVSIALISYEDDKKYEREKETRINQLRQYALENKQDVNQSAIDGINSKKNIKVRVGFKSETNNVATYNPARFSLKDSKNSKYNTYFKDPLGIYSVYPNEATEYDLEYLVPSEEINFNIIYENKEISFSIN